METFILIVHISACILLILIVLMQSSREDGLSGLFSGGGGGQPLFGPRSGNILTRITTVLAVGFMLTSLTLTIISARRPRRVIDKILKEEKTEETRTILPAEPETSISPEEEAGELP